MHMWRVKYACDEKSRIYYYNILKGLLKILDIYLCILLLQAILDYISVSILCSHTSSIYLFDCSKDQQEVVRSIGLLATRRNFFAKFTRVEVGVYNATCV